MKFTPIAGLVIPDCYMCGIGELRNICHEGVVEVVGKDYCIIRDLSLDEPILVIESKYCWLDVKEE